MVEIQNSIGWENFLVRAVVKGKFHCAVRHASSGIYGHPYPAAGNLYNCWYSMKWLRSWLTGNECWVGHKCKYVVMTVGVTYSWTMSVSKPSRSIKKHIQCVLQGGICLIQFWIGKSSPQTIKTKCHIVVVTIVPQNENMLTRQQIFYPHTNLGCQVHKAVTSLHLNICWHHVICKSYHKYCSSMWCNKTSCWPHLYFPTQAPDTWLPLGRMRVYSMHDIQEKMSDFCQCD
jgi:hypothetical protein